MAHPMASPAPRKPSTSEKRNAQFRHPSLSDNQVPNEEHPCDQCLSAADTKPLENLPHAVGKGAELARQGHTYRQTQHRQLPPKQGTTKRNMVDKHAIGRSDSCRIPPLDEPQIPPRRRATKPKGAFREPPTPPDAPSFAHLLSQDGERPLVRGQTQHNEIRIQPMQDVMLVGVVAWLTSLSSHEVHDLVFPFPGLIGI